MGPDAAGYVTMKHARIGFGKSLARDYGRSIVIYRGTFRREAVRLAHDLGFALVSPLDGLRARDLHGAQLAVIVGS